MDLADAIVLGIALGADSLSVSIGIGMGGVGVRRALKLACLFGGTQGVLLAGGVGTAAGLHELLDMAARSRGLLARLTSGLSVTCVHEVIHILLTLCGAVVLCLVGMNLFYGYFVRTGDEKPVYYRGRLALLLLALSVGIDAFSAGVGLGMLAGVSLTFVSLTVAWVIGAMAYFGLRAGRSIGRYIGRRAEPVGGLLLIVLALHLVWQAIA